LLGRIAENQCGTFSSCWNIKTESKDDFLLENVENQLILLRNRKAKTTLSVEKCGKTAHISEEPESKDDFYLWRNAENQLILLKNQKAKTTLAVEKCGKQPIIPKNQKAKTTFAVEKCGNQGGPLELMKCAGICPLHSNNSPLCAVTSPPPTLKSAMCTIIHMKTSIVRGHQDMSSSLPDQ
jgi:hypothetical protein